MSCYRIIRNLNNLKIEDDMEIKEINIPNNYKFSEIKDDKIILKKKKVEYPKTWDECIIKYNRTNEIEYINTYSNIIQLDKETAVKDLTHNFKNSIPKELGKAILALEKLLICREVYQN